MAEPLTYSGNGHTATIADPENITRDECLALARCGAEAWNAWRNVYPGDAGPNLNVASFAGHDFAGEQINFEGFRFGPVNFAKARFHRHQKFFRCSFGNGTSFEDAVFDGIVRFGGSTFGSVDFSRAQFSNWADFNTCDFGGSAHFDACVFDKGVAFTGAFLRRDVRFNGTRFVDDAHFGGTLFGTDTHFECAEFLGRANFDARTWSDLRHIYREPNRSVEEALSLAQTLSMSPAEMGDIDFSGAQFSKALSFSGRTFRARATFGTGERPVQTWTEVVDGRDQSVTKYALEPTRFAQAPQFFDCKVSQQLTFEEAIFPEASGDPNAARAYRTLKLAFSQQQATREEQRFFRLEMAEEAKAAENSRDPAQWLYIAYRELADFGFSVRRPALLLVVTLLLMLPLYAWQAGLHVCLPSSADCSMTGPLIQFASAHALPGFEKLAEPASKTLFGEHLGVWTVLTLLLHKAISVLALFLIGLALRNLFKMK